MDRYIEGCQDFAFFNPIKLSTYECSTLNNFAIASAKTMETYHNMSRKYAMSDRYFQASVGQSSQNDMFFARASYVFKNNDWKPLTKRGSNCKARDWVSSPWTHFGEYKTLYDPTIASLLDACNIPLTFFAEGYDAARYNNMDSLVVDSDCFPYGYDASDVPFSYYAGTKDNENFINDY